MIKSFNNNKYKVCLLLKDNVGWSCVRSCARSNVPGSRDYGVTKTINLMLTTQLG